MGTQITDDTLKASHLRVRSSKERGARFLVLCAAPVPCVCLPTALPLPKCTVTDRPTSSHNTQTT